MSEGQLPYVELDCGCIVQPSGGWIDVAPLQRLSVFCPFGHKWQNCKKEIAEPTPAQEGGSHASEVVARRLYEAGKTLAPQYGMVVKRCPFDDLYPLEQQWRIAVADQVLASLDKHPSEQAMQETA